MRYVNAPSIALSLSATLACLLVQLPRTTLGHPAAGAALAIVEVAVAALEVFASALTADMRSQSLSEEVEAKVWMHTGDPRLNGCGFYFQVDGHSGRRVDDMFPEHTSHYCHGDEYLMRMTSQSAAYEKRLHLGNDQVKRIEFHADGWHDTFVKMLCIGMSEHTVVGGPRAFCVTADLLKACKTEKNKWPHIDLEHDDIMLTRTARGIHKIIFTEIEQLVRAYESIGGDVNHPDAADTICDKIEVVRGTDYDDVWDCWAETMPINRILHELLLLPPPATRRDVNPYGCPRYEGSRR